MGVPSPTAAQAPPTRETAPFARKTVTGGRGQTEVLSLRILYQVICYLRYEFKIYLSTQNVSVDNFNYSFQHYTTLFLVTHCLLLFHVNFIIHRIQWSWYIGYHIAAGFCSSLYNQYSKWTQFVVVPFFIKIDFEIK